MGQLNSLFDYMLGTRSLDSSLNFRENGRYFLYWSLLICRSLYKYSIVPIDTGRKLNVHKTFRRRPGRLLNVLCTFNLRPVSTGVIGFDNSVFVKVKYKTSKYIFIDCFYMILVEFF